MGLRGIAGQFAKASSGLWQGVAEAIDPPRGEPDVPTTVGPASAGAVTDGAMLVPLDTWTRILEQIGNIHEAGQQVADARERAARAETENEFLRSQIADLKAKNQTTPRAADRAEPPSTQSAEIQPDGTRSTPARTVERARERASRWLSP